MTDKLVSDLVTSPGLASSVAGTDIALVSQDSGATLRPTLLDTLKTYLGAGITDALTFDTKAAFAASGLSFSGINYVLVRNVSGGFGGSMLWYKRGTSSPTGIYGEVNRGGVYWTPQYDTSPVDVGQWGYVADGTVGSNQLTGGTDNQPMIQAAIDWALQSRYATVVVPNGIAKVGDTIHLGYGDQYRTIKLQSRSGAAFAPGLAGCLWGFTRTDRPGINLQGLRQGEVRGIFGLGKNYPWIIANRVGLPSPVAGFNSLSSVAADWLDPALTPAGSSPGGLQQHSPYAFITVDAFKGAQPTDHYVDDGTNTPPAWTGLSVHYNPPSAPSSEILIEKCNCYGFAVGICGSPNGDGNGDFIKIRDFSPSYNVYGVAVCNSQSRGVEISYLNVNGAHTGITTKAFGAGNALLGGTINNYECTTVYRMLGTDANAVVGTTMAGWYNEVGVYVADFGTTAGSIAGSITLKGLQWGGAEELHGSVPKSLFVIPPGLTLTLEEASLAIGSRLGVLATGGGNLIIKSNLWQGTFEAVSGATNGSAAFQRAFNHSGGIMCPGHDALAPTPSQQGSVLWIGDTNGRYLTNATDSVPGSQQLNERMNWGGLLRRQMTQATQKFADQVGSLWRLPYRNNVRSIDVSDTGSYPAPPSINGQTLTFTTIVSNQDSGMILIPGDFLFHPATGTMFVVTVIPGASGGNYAISAVQQNNMEVHPTTKALITNHVTTANLAANTAWVVMRAGPIMPQQVSFGTFTSGSTAVTGVSRGDGYAGNTSTFYTTADKLIGFPYSGSGNADRWPIAGGAAWNAFSAVTNGGTMTLSGAAQMGGDFPIYPVPIAR